MKHGLILGSVHSEKRPSTLLLIMISGVVLLSVLALLVFLPIWHCPWCDRPTLERIFPHITFTVVPSTCERCDGTGRMNLYRRWQAIRKLREANVYRIPNFH